MAKLLAATSSNILHRPVRIEIDDVQTDAIDHVIYHMEEVLLDKAYYSIYRNYLTAHKAGLKVVLNGQGSDEVWLGYYNIYPFIRKFQDKLTLTDFSAYWLEQFSLKNYAHTSQLQAVITNHLTPHFGTGNLSPLDAMVAFGTRTHLQSMLVQEDRLSMASSVECRVPFVDYRVISLAMQVPSTLKLLDGREKYLIRKLGESFLPAPIYKRHKAVLPDMPDHFGQIADEAISHGTIQKSHLLKELFSKALSNDLQSLSASDKWKLFSLSRFEKVFFNLD
jgi:asparagine synthase (glutamine-hydrolysing)